MRNLTAVELVKKIGDTWGTNNYVGFMSLFRKDSYIIHPYFKQPVMPSVAMEIINTAVKGTTKLKSYEILEGDGSGKYDVVRMKFIETGSEIPNAPTHIGTITVTGVIKDHLYQSLEVNGIEVNQIKSSADPLSIPHVEYGELSSQAIAEKLADTWGSNKAREFLGLFCGKAKIKHIVLNEEVTPEVVAEVMNCNVKGTTKLRNYALLMGDGRGKDDIVEMTFEETGIEIGYTPSLKGLMGITAKIKEHRIEHLNVHGYQVADTPS